MDYNLAKLYQHFCYSLELMHNLIVKKIAELNVLVKSEFRFAFFPKKSENNLQQIMINIFCMIQICKLFIDNNKKKYKVRNVLRNSKGNKSINHFL